MDSELYKIYRKSFFLPTFIGEKGYICGFQLAKNDQESKKKNSSAILQIIVWVTCTIVLYYCVYYCCVHYCWELFMCTIALYSCSAILLCTLLLGTMLCTIVLYSCSALLLCTVAVHYCCALLFGRTREQAARANGIIKLPFCQIVWQFTIISFLLQL